MKFSKLLGRTLTAAAVLSAACLGYTVKKGCDFNDSIEKTDDTLDRCVIGAKTSILYPETSMQDIKIGAFFSTVTVDLTHLRFTECQYDLDIDLRASTLCIILPENVKLNLTDRCIAGKIYDETTCSGAPVSTLSIYAKVYKGALCFKTAKTVS